MAMDRLENLKNIIMYLMADNRVSHRIPSTLEERQRMMRALMNVWEPRPISNDFLTMQDAELQMQCEDKGVVEISDITPQTSDIRLWQGDITRLKVDAIVNAANAQALGCWAPLHNCIDNCIHSAAGIQLRKECADKMQLDLAEQNGLESIAFCCISTGVFHFPNQRAAEIAIETVKSYPRHSLKTIVFNVFLDKDRDIYRQLL